MSDAELAVKFFMRGHVTYADSRTPGHKREGPSSVSKGVSNIVIGYACLSLDSEPQDE